MSSNAQVQMVYQIASLRDKVGLLLAYQCGLNPVDIEELNIEEMPIYDAEGKVQIIENQYFEVDRSKTGVLTQTCLSYELLHDIDLYLALPLLFNNYIGKMTINNHVILIV